MNTYDKMGDIIPTGINHLDALLEGGLHKGELCLIAARSGIEKTIFATHIAGNIAKEGKKVCFISLEMSEEQLKNHMAKQGYGDVSITIDTYPKASPKYILNKLETDKAEVAVIDYLELIQADEERVARRQEIFDIAYELRKLSEDLDIPIICTTQISRPRDGHLPELEYPFSVEIEQEASVIITLYRADYYYDTDMESDYAEIIIAKNKHGSNGTIPATFDKETLTFKDNILKATESYEEWLL